MRDPADREIRLGFWKLHILHHAAKGPVHGWWMLRELEEHGHRMSPGTLYPLLARLAENGWLRADTPEGPKARISGYIGHRTMWQGASAIVLAVAIAALNPQYGFWSIAHAARTDFSMLLGSVFQRRVR